MCTLSSANPLASHSPGHDGNDEDGHDDNDEDGHDDDADDGDQPGFAEYESPESGTSSEGRRWSTPEDFVVDNDN